MTDVSKNPIPEDLGERTVYENCSVPITRLLERTIAAGKGGRLEDLKFRNCFIFGPGYVIADPGTTFDRCDLGNVGSDVRNLFLIAAGTHMSGGVFLKACAFEDCRFRNVAFAGSQSYVDAWVRELSKSAEPRR